MTPQGADGKDGDPGPAGTKGDKVSGGGCVGTMATVPICSFTVLYVDHL